MFRLVPVGVAPSWRQATLDLVRVKIAESTTEREREADGAWLGEGFNRAALVRCERISSVGKPVWRRRHGVSCGLWVVQNSMRRFALVILRRGCLPVFQSGEYPLHV